MTFKYHKIEKLTRRDIQKPAIDLKKTGGDVIEIGFDNQINRLL